MSKQKLKDPLGQHVRLYAIVYKSPAWKVLSPSAKALWCDLRVQIGSTSNGTATTALGILGHYGWTSRHTVMRAREELVALGLIQITKQGGICSGGKTPNLYRFTDLETYDILKKGITAHKADHLYKKVTSIVMGKQMLKSLRVQKKSKVKNEPFIDAVATLNHENVSAEFTS